MPSDTVSQAQGNEETIKTSLVFPKDLWDEVKIHGIRQGTSANQLCIDALRSLLRTLKPEGIRKAG